MATKLNDVDACSKIGVIPIAASARDTPDQSVHAKQPDASASTINGAGQRQRAHHHAASVTLLSDKHLDSSGVAPPDWATLRPSTEGTRA